jgi:hypothetical protein
LSVKSIVNQVAKLEFLVVTGHTYHLRSSVDAVNWVDQPFSVSADASNLVPHLLADSVTILNVYVPVTDKPTAFFILYVE